MRMFAACLAVAALAVACVCPFAEAGEKSLVEKKPAPVQTNRIVMVINNLPGTHYVTLRNQVRFLAGPNSICFFSVPLGGYDMVQLDGGFNKWCHIGTAFAPDFKIIWTSWCNTGPF